MGKRETWNVCPSYTVSAKFYRLSVIADHIDDSPAVIMTDFGSAVTCSGRSL